MFQLLNPIALLAAAAVIIPVLMHLWNTRRGKTLKVGSIALLKESARKPSYNFRINNWPLLLIRCLVFLLAALLLARPFRNDDPSHTKSAWILAAPQQLATAYRQNSRLIDSLLRAGSEIRNLFAATQQLALSDTADYRSDAVVHNEIIWPYLKYLDAALPEKFPVYLFSEKLLQSFAGSRPSLQLDLKWIRLHGDKLSDTTAVTSYTDDNGRSVSTRFISGPFGNYYDNVNSGIAGLEDTSTIINIGVYAGDHTVADAKYIKAAIEAIAAYTGRTILINKPGLQQQTIFWLQDSNPDKNTLSLLAPQGTLFRYDNAAIISSAVSAPGSDGIPVTGGAEADQFYRYATGPLHGRKIWELSNGDPLMSIESSGNIRTVYFRSRFNPQWTDLVWKEHFVKLLLPFIVPVISNSTDLRGITEAQAQPAISDKKLNGSVSEIGFIHQKDLQFPVWIALFIAFLAERILAYHQTNRRHG